jgi:predicted outer membrane repeat protein
MVPVTNTLDGGPGSLRQAVLDASGGDTVVFDSGMFSVPLTISLTSGPISINTPLTINGAASNVVTPTVSGNGTSQVFLVSGVGVTLNRLAVTGGNCNSWICSGGAIYNTGLLTLTGVVLSGNVGGMGGALFNGGTLTVMDSAFTANSATYGGGLYSNFWARASLVNTVFTGNQVGTGYGGGVENDGLLIITGCTFAGNVGGVLYNSGTVIVTHSAFRDNWNPYGAGAVFMYSSDLSATLDVSGSTFERNGSAYIGGAIYNPYMGSSGMGVVTVTNSSFISNSAPQGGAIYSRGWLTLINSILVSNSAQYGGGVDSARLSAVNVTLAANQASISGSNIYNMMSATLVNTIVADGVGQGNCAGEPITDHGHNLDSGDACGFTVSRSLTDTNPLLGPLGYYGGSVPTLPLLRGSPAIDAGDDAICPATDVRGVHRPQGMHCDIGAYEAFNRYWWMPVIRR